MTRRVPMSPRKAPRQARSRAMVDAILDATARVLVKDGYEGTTTNRVAALAGVSVGSLYQYFPNKESLVAGVIDRHCDEMEALFESKIAALSNAPVPVAARELIQLLIECHALNPKLHRVLMEQVPRVGKLARMRAVRDQVAGFLRVYLEPRRRDLRPKNLDLAIFVVVTAIEALGHALSVEQARPVSADTIDEMTALVVRYLLPVPR
jgi:AcrR family transcriptional regulator